MRIAVIGAGQVGGALARAWTLAGHSLILGTRDPTDRKLAPLLATTGGPAMAPPAAAAAAELVVLAVPWSAAEATCRSLGDLGGKVLVDCTNPLIFRNGRLAVERGFTISGGEAVAGWTTGARVVKTLNTVGAELMADSSGLPLPPLMFMAGDDPAAKASVAPLLVDLGFDPRDAEPLTSARLLEPLAMLWIDQALVHGAGRNWAFAMSRRPEQR